MNKEIVQQSGVRRQRIGTRDKNNGDLFMKGNSQILLDTGAEPRDLGIKDGASFQVIVLVSLRSAKVVRSVKRVVLSSAAPLLSRLEMVYAEG